MVCSRLGWLSCGTSCWMRLTGCWIWVLSLTCAAWWVPRECPPKRTVRLWCSALPTLMTSKGLLLNLPNVDEHNCPTRELGMYKYGSMFLQDGGWLSQDGLFVPGCGCGGCSLQWCGADICPGHQVLQEGAAPWPPQNNRYLSIRQSHFSLFTDSTWSP